MAKSRCRMIRLEKIDSTNTYMKGLAEKGESEGCVAVAREQSRGRGRRGKSFFSPLDTGLYMSILLRPKCSIEASLFITSMTAVAVAKAIESVTGKECGIKWVNDIYIDDKKVSGILCEGSFDYTADKVNYVIAGIGINLADPVEDFPQELKDIASSLGSIEIKEQLLQRLIDEFFKLYDSLPSTEYLDEYRERSVLTGKRVEILGEEPLMGTAVGIDEKCRLIMVTDNGETKTISSGEVSARIVK